MNKTLAITSLFAFALSTGCMKKAPETAAPAPAAPATTAPATTTTAPAATTPATTAPATTAPATAAMPKCCSMEKGAHTCQHGDGGSCCAGHASASK